MGVPPSLKTHYLVKRNRISKWHAFMGLWNDCVAISIKRYNFKGSKIYDSFYVIDFNFAIVYRRGVSFHPKGLWLRYGIPLWACEMIMLLSALKHLTLKVVRIWPFLCHWFSFCESLQKWAFFLSLKANDLIKRNYYTDIRT